MRLPAEPNDFVAVQLDTSAAVGASDTTADLVTGGGSELPTISSGRWVFGIVVNVTDPDAVSLADYQAGDVVYITAVSSDTLTFVRTGTARPWNPGEYLLLTHGAWHEAVLMRKIEDLERAIYNIAGGYDFAPRYGADGAPNELLVEETDPASMAVQVRAGLALVDGQVFRIRETTESEAITAPTGNPRIDLVQAVIGEDGSVDSMEVKNGAEAGSPSAPTVDTGCIELAEVSLSVGQTSILNANITNVLARS